MVRLIATLGRSVDCEGCHRPILEGSKYWHTDDGSMCDLCLQRPTPVHYSGAEILFFKISFLLMLAIVIGVMLV